LNHRDEFLRGNCENQPRFCHVKRLSLNGYLIKEIFDRIRYHIDIKKIEHFQFCSTIDDNDGFVDLIKEMTNLSSLHIQYPNILHLLRLISSPMFTI